jgi:hypothetical protein
LKDGSFGKAIDNDENGIIPVGLWEGSDHVDRDGVPGMRGNIVDVEGCSTGLSVWFDLLTLGATLNVVGDVLVHSGPPIVTRYEFLCLGNTRVTCSRGIVDRGDDMAFKSCIRGNVKSCIIVDLALFSFREVSIGFGEGFGDFRISLLNGD